VVVVLPDDGGDVTINATESSGNSRMSSAVCANTRLSTARRQARSPRPSRSVAPTTTRSSTWWPRTRLHPAPRRPNRPGLGDHDRTPPAARRVRGPAGARRQFAKPTWVRRGRSRRRTRRGDPSMTFIAPLGPVAAAAGAVATSRAGSRGRSLAEARFTVSCHRRPRRRRYLGCLAAAQSRCRGPLSPTCGRRCAAGRVDRVGPRGVRVGRRSAGPRAPR
jgi:hypothetical protein